MKLVKKVPDWQELSKDYSLDEGQKNSRRAFIKEIQQILDGKDRRKLLIIGPCSADREDAVLDYMLRLAALREKVKEVFVIIPRIYTSKPRTNGLGYKGMLHRPDPSGKNDDLLRGLIAARRLHFRIVSETGLFGADEMLYPEAFYNYMDLVSYAAVGARSVENQQHRLVASGLDVPVGMKNPTSGDLKVMLNAISAARHPHHMFFHGWVAETEGNPYAHAILRGSEDVNGNVYPNYHYENLCKLYDLFHAFNLASVNVIVDCNHSNSGKKYEEQIRIAEEVAHNCHQSKVINQFVKGLMIESYLQDGKQMVGEGIYGKSITDPCLGWEKTKRLVLRLANSL